MSKEKGGKPNQGNLGGVSSSKDPDPLRAKAEAQWEEDYQRKHVFNHSESGPFTPLTELSRKGKEPSQSGPTSVFKSPSDAQSGSASNRKRKNPQPSPAPAPSSPGGKGVGNNAGKGHMPS